MDAIPTPSDDELLGLLTEALPKSRHARLRADAGLREIGLDSLGLMLVVSRFLERYPSSASTFEARLAEVRTLGDLLALGRAAIDNARKSP